LYYDTVLLSAAAVRFLYDYVGSQRVLVGSDFGAAPKERAGVQITAAVREASDDDVTERCWPATRSHCSICADRPREE
jgi:hypothetical protein